MKTRLLLSLLVFVFVACAHAEPTPIDKSLAWDDYTDTNGTGFELYWAPSAESPRVYGNARRVDVDRPDPEVIADVLTFLPTLKSTICFKLTAYDDAGHESAYSNEVCKWLGISKPENAR